MAMTAEEIGRLIRAGLPDAEVTLEDLAGDGNHYRAHVVSPAFRGKTPGAAAPDGLPGPGRAHGRRVACTRPDHGRTRVNALAESQP